MKQSVQPAVELQYSIIVYTRWCNLTMWILLVVLLVVSLSVSTVSGQEQRESQLPRLQARQSTNGDLTTAVHVRGGVRYLDRFLKCNCSQVDHAHMGLLYTCAHVHLQMCVFVCVCVCLCVCLYVWVCVSWCRS